MSEPWSRDPFADPPASATPLPGEGGAPERPRYRPPIGIPVPTQSRLGSTLLSVALHALVLFLLITPLVLSNLPLEEVDGAGGPGPAGGGGGGRRGTGGDVERLHYMQVAPAPAPVAAPTPVAPPVTPPVVPPPKVEPPKPEPVPTPQPEPTPTPAAQAPASAVPAPTAGTGGGTGNDGTNGSGPGSGGGVGAGIGTGRGSGTGPGTGGGNAANRPPVATEVPIPPLPVPGKLKGTQVIAVFDVDSTGKVLGFDFTKTKDGGYDKKLREIFATVRFRPGTGLDGTPIRSKGSLTFELY